MLHFCKNCPKCRYWFETTKIWIFSKIVKIAILDKPLENVDFGSRLSKMSIYGQICQRCLFWIKNVVNVVFVKIVVEPTILRIQFQIANNLIFGNLKLKWTFFRFSNSNSRYRNIWPTINTPMITNIFSQLRGRIIIQLLYNQCIIFIPNLSTTSISSKNSCKYRYFVRIVAIVDFGSKHR